MTELNPLRLFTKERNLVGALCQDARVAGWRSGTIASHETRATPRDESTSSFHGPSLRRFFRRSILRAAPGHVGFRRLPLRPRQGGRGPLGRRLRRLGGLRRERRGLHRQSQEKG